MKKEQQIRVIEYVHTADGGLKPVAELGAEEYERFRQWLVRTWVNTLYQGRAEVVFPEETGRTDSSLCSE